MKLQNALMKLIPKRKLKIKSFNGEVATEAFKHGGHTYYQFQDNFRMPTGRAICSLAIYAELKMRCDDDYLKLHIEATEKILNAEDGKIRLTKLAQINANLKERLNLAPFPDHIYKLASVIFFDESENPNGYDFEYNQKKIANWKKDSDLLYFFLSVPFKDLIPFGNISKGRAESYLNTTILIDQLHVSNLRDIVSSKL